MTDLAMVMGAAPRPCLRVLNVLIISLQAYRKLGELEHQYMREIVLKKMDDFFNRLYTNADY